MGAGAQTSESRARLPSFALQSVCSLSLPPPAPPLPPHQLSSQTLTHSFPRPPTNHPFAQTTQLLPSSAPGDNGHTTPTLPGPTPKPNYHLAPLLQAGKGGTDLRLCLEISWAQEACFPLDIKGQEQIRGPLGSLPPHCPVSGPRLLGQEQEDKMVETPFDPLSSGHSERMEGMDLAALRGEARRAPQKEPWTGSQRLGSSSEPYSLPLLTHLGLSSLVRKRGCPQSRRALWA